MRLLRDEHGWTLIPALILMSIMLTGALATLGIVDTQTTASAGERRREASFTLAEAALNAEVFSLARDWPGVGMAANPYPTCTPQSSTTRCPSNAQLLALFPTTDTIGATWQTSVRDNGVASSQSFYSDADTQTQPGYDANGDGKVWLRAQATVGGKRRTLVALVRVEQQEEDVPHAALIAQRLTISNMGNKTIIDASASGNQGLVQVRCAPQSGESTPCLGHTWSDLGGSLDWFRTKPQILPLPTIANTGYAGGPALSPEARARLKATAIANGTYYTSCPSADRLSGQVVYIESGVCSYTSNTSFNAAGSPGVLIVNSGSISFGGTSTFFGVVYNANATNSSDVAVETQGNATIVGGVLVDGPGSVVAGSSATNIILDLRAFDAVRSYGSAGVIQNSWREIPGA